MNILNLALAPKLARSFCQFSSTTLSLNCSHESICPPPPCQLRSVAQRPRKATLKMQDQKMWNRKIQDLGSDACDAYYATSCFPMVFKSNFRDFLLDNFVVVSDCSLQTYSLLQTTCSQILHCHGPARLSYLYEPQSTQIPLSKMSKNEIPQLVNLLGHNFQTQIKNILRRSPKGPANAAKTIGLLRSSLALVVMSEI